MKKLTDGFEITTAMKLVVELGRAQTNAAKVFRASLVGMSRADKRASVQDFNEGWDTARRFVAARAGFGLDGQPLSSVVP